MSRIRVLMLAAIVGVVMVIPAPLTVWAGDQGHKVAKQDEKGEQNEKGEQKEGEKKQETEKEGQKKQEKQKPDKEAESTEHGKREKKVTICHRPGGKPENAKTITVGASAVEKHLAHGDSRGPCQ